MKSIAVLLTVFNRKASTLQCLHALFDQDMPEGYDMTVYMTNDGCTDGTPEAVKKEFPDVKIIDGDGNLYWNRGMFTAWDTAAKEKDYDFYLWLNDDCSVYPYLIARLTEASTSKDDNTIIVGATQSHNHSKQTYGGRLLTDCFPKIDGTLAKIDYFNGNIVFIPRAVFKQLGNLDYYFTHRFGDYDYGMRAKKACIDMWQVGEYLGECDEHPSLDMWCNPEVPFSQRWKRLWQPNGMPPNEVFHFENQHKNIIIASMHYCSTILHCCFPIIWK